MTTGWQRADALLENPDAMLALLKDPKRWLQQHGISEDDLLPSTDADTALEKAEEVAAKADELARLPLLVALPRLRELAASAWPEGIDVEGVPFGVRLAERPRPIPPQPILDDNPKATTGTGSISCTFSLRCKADVDR
jgi:hypothetical protein